MGRTSACTLSAREPQKGQPAGASVACQVSPTKRLLTRSRPGRRSARSLNRPWLGRKNQSPALTILISFSRPYTAGFEERNSKEIA